MVLLTVPCAAVELTTTIVNAIIDVISDSALQDAQAALRGLIALAAQVENRL